MAFTKKLQTSNSISNLNNLYFNFKSLIPGWIIVFSLFILMDASVLMIRPLATEFDFIVYILSAGMTMLGMYGLELMRRALPGWFGRAYVWIISVAIGFILVQSLAVYSQFGQYTNASMMQFVINNPEYLKSFLRIYLLNANIVFFLAFCLIISWFWNWKLRKKKKYRLWKNFAGSLSLLVIFLIILNQINYGMKDKSYTADVSLYLAAKKVGHNDLHGLHSAAKLNVNPFINADSLNIILFINESFGKHAFPGMKGIHSMPFLHSLLENNPDQYLYFKRGYTNSGSTDVSTPSILNGVAPWEGSKKIHEMPFFWDWCKAAGMQTILVSAQSFEWAKFIDFYLSPGPDSHLTADETNEKFTNDTGIDEMFSMTAFCDSIAAMPADKNFAAVYMSNALHIPYQISSEYFDGEGDFESRYQQSSWLLDRTYRFFFEKFSQDPRFENTLIIITADHGDTDWVLHNMVNRLYNFYEEIMNIPIIIRLPKKLIETRKALTEELRSNIGSMVSNIDILPTILDILNAGNASKELTSKFSGLSLTKGIDPGRVSIALNTNDIRMWDNEGFGIFMNDWRFVYSDIEKAALYDISIDTLQQNNIWGKAEPQVRDKIESIIDSVFHLKRMYVKKAG